MHIMSRVYQWLVVESIESRRQSGDELSSAEVNVVDQTEAGSSSWHWQVFRATELDFHVVLAAVTMNLRTALSFLQIPQL